MIHAAVSDHINSSAGRVYGLYSDPDNWPKIFPTIRAVRIVRESGDEMVVEVDHVYEGKVINVVRRVSPTQIDLDEEKRRYNAFFQNLFEPEAGGTRFTVIVEVRLKGLYRLVAPFVKPIVLSQMRRSVLAPMKSAAERQEARCIERNPDEDLHRSVPGHQHRRA